MNRPDPGSTIDAVDVHSHIMPLSYLKLGMAQPDRYGVSIDRREAGYVMTTKFWSLGRYIEYGPFSDDHFEWEARLRHMDATGVRTQVLSATQSLAYYWAPVDVALDVCRLCNDAMAEAAAQHPGRFYGLASLPMQDIDSALKELDRAIGQLRLSGVQLLTNVNGENIFSRRFLPILQRIHDLEVPIFIHPYGCLNDERMSEGFLANVVGFPSELALTGAGFILTGMLDELPRLKIILAHGGGSFLYLLGRITRGYEVVESLRKQLKKPPREYLHNFHIDTALHDEQALRYAADTIGANRVLFGTDWPFWMQDPEMAGRLNKVSGLTPADVALIRHRNADDLFAFGSTPEPGISRANP